MCGCCIICCFFFFKQKTAYEMRISDWSSDVCSSDLAVVGRRGVFEQPLVLGEERPLVADEGLGGAEVDNQVVALDLAEIRIERGGELELAAGLPEDVGATLEVAAAADVVVQARNIRRDRQQRLAVHRHLERLEIRQEARMREAEIGRAS